MDSVEAIVLAAWNGIQPFHASSPAERLTFLLEFLDCNGAGSESDDRQAEMIRECRRLAFAGEVKC